MFVIKKDLFSISNILIYLIILFSLISFVNISTKNIPINFNIIFEFLFLAIFYFIFIKFKLNYCVVIYMLINITYILFSINQFILLEHMGKFNDFLIIYKAFFYLLFLSFFVNKNYLNQKFLRNLFNILLIFFLVKYILMKLFGYGFQGRPELFTENNFELIMLLILYIGIYSREKKIKKLDLIFLSIIFLLSGSRSGIGGFFIMLYFLDFGNSMKLKLIKLISLSLGLIAIVFIFTQRLGSGNIEDIDRIKFLFYFIKEIESWSIINYLFGASFMTPMTYETSKALNYYEILFSNYDKLLTYSVVLHSFILRTIFDHGFLGFLFLFFTLWKFLGYSKYNKREKSSIILILIATGLSVSSLNSIFVTFSLGLILITKRNNIEKYIQTN